MTTGRHLYPVYCHADNVRDIFSQVKDELDILTWKADKQGVTTTTTPDQESTPVMEVEPSSYPATGSLKSLLDPIPEQHQQPMVMALVNQAVKEYTPLELEEAIVYASVNVKGGALQYKAYLDKTLKNQWAAGYLETMQEQTIIPAVFSPGGFSGGVHGRYPNGTVTGSARMDGNYMAAAQFLNDMGMEV